MGKPRMTRADKWKKRPEILRYRAFCDEVRLQGVELPESGSHVTFILPMPASWNKKKRAELNGKPHQAKPDFDNMMKRMRAYKGSESKAHDRYHANHACNLEKAAAELEKRT